MKKALISLLLITAAALLIAGCAAKKEVAVQADTKGEAITIAPGDFFEVCDMERNWTPGAEVSFAFTSSAPVVFNVHYHEKHAKMYAIEQTVTDNFKGSFVVQGEGIHCGMWKNDTTGDVTLSYDVSVGK